MKLVLTSEHGGNNIPKKYKSFFQGKEQLLQSHRGYDPGTLDLIEFLKEIADFSKIQKVSRLLIECNRSLHHPHLFSEISKPLDSKIKQEIIQEYYRKYRDPITKNIQKEIEEGNWVLHISLHSFTPSLNEKTRNNDIGLLYDPKRVVEKQFCVQWKKILSQESPTFKIRYNYPYAGNADGFTTYLRKKFKNHYLGIELELNQKLFEKGAFPMQLKGLIKNTLLNLKENYFIDI